MSALREAIRELPGGAFADLLVSDDAYLLVVDLPGAVAGTTTITAKEGRLHIEARREKDVPDEFSYRREDRPLFLDVDLPLPRDATGGEARAKMDRGILELTLPKRATAESTDITIEDA